MSLETFIMLESKDRFKTMMGEHKDPGVSFKASID